MPLGPAGFEDQQVTVGERLIAHPSVINEILILW